MQQNNEAVISETSRMQQMWGWWRAKLELAAKSPWYASYLLRRFYDLMKALKPSKQLVASTVTGAALLVGSIAMNPMTAQAANNTINVNSTVDDTLANLALNGTCDLREALEAVRTSAVVGQCAHDVTTTGTDTINLTVAGPITLVADLPTITPVGRDIVLKGPGAANLTIDGVSQTYQTISSTGNGNNVTVDGLTIKGSKFKGVIASYGSITVTNSTVSGNGTHGVNAIGNATVTGSTILGNNEMGVYTTGNATVSNSTISGNKEMGVNTTGNASVTNSTISGNGSYGVYAKANAIVTGSTISGNNKGGVTAKAGDITVSNSTISGTIAGEGVYAQHGKASVSSSTISGNQKMGVYARHGNATVTNSTISGNNGNGVFAYKSNATVTNSIISGNNNDGVRAYDGDVTVTNSTISGNNEMGGLVHNNGNITITNSTISGNKKGGVSTYKGNATVTNSTISGNNNDGVYVTYYNITVINSTITGNTGKGVFVKNLGGGTAVVTLTNSLIVGNGDGTTTHDVDCSAVGATLVSNGKNLIKTQTGAACPMASEKTGFALASILSPLANNGGSTQTHALVAGSPAIDKGLNSDAVGIMKDQRGLARIFGGTVDIGAFEFVAAAVGGVAELITPPVNDGVMWRVVGLMGAGLAMGLGVLGLRRGRE